jgi:hypothetical protein
MTRNEHQVFLLERSTMEIRLLAFVAAYARLITAEKVTLASWITAGGASKAALLDRLEVLNEFTSALPENAEELQEAIMEEGFGPDTSDAALQPMLTNLAVNGRI